MLLADFEPAASFGSMLLGKSNLWLALGVGLVAGGCSLSSEERAANMNNGAVAGAFPSAAALPVIAGLPDPLVKFDGTPVRSAREWREERRPELKRLFAHYMYGSIPPVPGESSAVALGEFKDFMGGKATLR